MQTVTTWRDQEDEPYTKVINEAFPEPDWDKIDPPMKGQGLVNEALMWGASAGIAAAVKPIAGMLGTAKTIDMGLNLIDPNASDVALDQAMEFIQPANPIKVGAKGIRILSNMLTDVFDRRVSPEDLPPLNLAESHKRHPQITKLSDLKKQARNRRILDETSIDDGYIEEIVEHGDDVIYPEGSIEANIQANTQAMGADYSYRKGRALKNPIWDNLPEKTQKKFAEAGMDSDQAKFFIENWEGPIPREMSAAIEGGFSDSTFKFMQSELLPQMLEDMKGVNLSDGIQLDHIAQLRALLPFYNKRNLKQIYKIRRILVKEGIFGGHNPKNLQYLPTDVHTVKTNFWEQQVGKDGSKFFKGRPMRTYADVEKAAKEMKAFINRSNDIVEKVSSQYYLMRKNKISIEELDAILQKVDLNQGPYNLKEVRTLIDEISIDTKTLGGYTGQNTIFSQIVSDNISDLVKFTENNIRGEEALLDVIFKGMSPAAALKKYKKFDPTITQGTFNKYLKQARQKDVMEQLKNLRRGKSHRFIDELGMIADD